METKKEESSQQEQVNNVRCHREAQFFIVVLFVLITEKVVSFRKSMVNLGKKVSVEYEDKQNYS